MDFKYREMVYKPDYYNFHIDDRTEWLPNGIFNYNVSRMIKDLDELEANPEAASLSWHSVLKEDVSVLEAINANFGLGKLEEAHIEQADLARPLIYVEIAPDSFNLIDGHHRLAKADQQEIETLPAYFVYAHAAVNYLSSQEEYCRYVEYWNQKVEDYDQPDFPGNFCFEEWQRSEKWDKSDRKERRRNTSTRIHRSPM